MCWLILVNGCLADDLRSFKTRAQLIPGNDPGHYHGNCQHQYLKLLGNENRYNC